MTETKLVKKSVLLQDIESEIAVIADPTVKGLLDKITDDNQLLLVEYTVSSKKKVTCVTPVNKDLLNKALSI